MDLTEFEKAKLKLVDARKVVVDATEALDAARIVANSAANAVSDIKREIHLAFLAAGGVVVRISDDGDLLLAGPHRVFVLKAGLVADRQVGKLSQNEFSLSTVEGRSVHERYRQFYSRAVDYNCEQFATLYDALCSTGVLDAAKDRMIVCDHHYFVREDDGWKELKAE